MEVVLIEGYANAGKSTLVRCLSGIGNANHNHANCGNVLLLDWVNPQTQLNTLVLASSLNEGITVENAKELSKGTEQELGSAIPPWLVSKLLDEYRDKCSAQKAILCISATALQRDPNWNAQAYATWLLLNNGCFGRHPVTHVVSLNDSHAAPLPLFVAAGNLNITSQQFLAHGNVTRNGLASQVRPFISLV